MTPGTQPQSVNKNTINIEPQPLSMTDNGGNSIANITLSNDINDWIYACKDNYFIVWMPCILMRYFLEKNKKHYWII